MTAEAAIMNRHGIALAADSAVTVHGEKVFNTANKIFALSQDHAVGLMVYGNGDLMRVPWETLIKLFRAHLRLRAFPTLDGYVDELVSFLNGLSGAPDVFTPDDQVAHVRLWSGVVYGLIRDQINKEVDRRLASGGLASRDVESLAAEEIARFHANCRKAALLDSATITAERELRRTYRPVLAEVRKDVFEQLPLRRTAVRHLNDIGVAVFTRSWLRPLPFASGIVVAGYGVDDVFPRLRELEIAGIVGHRLLYKRLRTADIGTQNTASVMAFAQQEMVYRFMEGIDPEYRDVTERDLNVLWGEALRAVVDAIVELPDDAKQRYRRVAGEVGKAELKRYLQRLREYRQEKFVEPVMDIVESLPKGELAEMAESLVNLTSLKRRMSSEKETVGGPIDVAVISKGDGLVWIRRKHYFRPELNPQFLARYAWEVHHGGTQE